MNEKALKLVTIFFKVEMTGSSIFDYVHHQDHSEMAEQLGLGLAQGQSMASPGSGSEEGASTTGTNNPDGKFESKRKTKS